MTPAQLADRRRAAGLTQQQLADLIGRDHNTISRYELGRLSIPEPTARLIELLLPARRHVGQ